MKFIHLFFSMYKCSTKEQCSDDLVMRQSVYSYILLVSLLIERFFFSIFSADSPLYIYVRTAKPWTLKSHDLSEVVIRNDSEDIFD